MVLDGAERGVCIERKARKMGYIYGWISIKYELPKLKKELGLRCRGVICCDKDQIYKDAFYGEKNGEEMFFYYNAPHNHTPIKINATHWMPDLKLPDQDE